MIDEIFFIADGDFMTDGSSLSPRFFEGYYNQRYVLTNEKAMEEERMETSDTDK